MPTRRAAAAVAAIAIGIAGLLAGCGGEPHSPAARPVTLGVLADQRTPEGAEAIQAAQLAVALINEAHPAIGLPLASESGLPALSGSPVVLAVGDLADEPDDPAVVMGEVSAATPVTGFVIAADAELVATAGAYADRQRVPLVDAASSADFLLEVGLDWYFRLTPSDRMLAAATFGLLATEPPPAADGRVTVLTAADGSGAGVAAALAEPARTTGWEVTTTLTAQELPFALAGTAPDPVIAIAATAPQAAELTGLLAESGPPRPVIGMGAGFRAASPPSAGLVTPTGWSAEFAQRHPLAAEVTARYQEVYDTPMSGAGAAAFTATLTLALAVQGAGAGDPAAVRAGLRQLSIPATETIMPWNGIRFNEAGQNQLAAAVVEQHTAQGPVLVHPPELATAEVAWPAPEFFGEGGR